MRNTGSSYRSNDLPLSYNIFFSNDQYLRRPINGWKKIKIHLTFHCTSSTSSTISSQCHAKSFKCITHCKLPNSFLYRLNDKQCFLKLEIIAIHICLLFSGKNSKKGENAFNHKNSRLKFHTNRYFFLIKKKKKFPSIYRVNPSFALECQEL